jgi:hypothetical protein
VKQQSFEDYYYRNIHAEGCGCSELIIENYEIDRKSRDFSVRRGGLVSMVARWIGRLMGRRKDV